MSNQSLTNDQVLERLSRMANSKADWLKTFSEGRQKRPDHEITYERENLEVLTGLRDAYAKRVGAEV